MGKILPRKKVCLRVVANPGDYDPSFVALCTARLELGPKKAKAMLEKITAEQAVVQVPPCKACGNNHQPDDMGGGVFFCAFSGELIEEPKATSVTPLKRWLTEVLPICRDGASLALTEDQETLRLWVGDADEGTTERLRTHSVGNLALVDLDADDLRRLGQAWPDVVSEVLDYNADLVEIEDLFRGVVAALRLKTATTPAKLAAALRAKSRLGKWL